MNNTSAALLSTKSTSVAQQERAEYPCWLLGGGVKSGEIIMFVGQTGGGKSLFWDRFVQECQHADH